jgi:hypothetical protein
VSHGIVLCIKRFVFSGKAQRSSDASRKDLSATTKKLAQGQLLEGAT